MIDTLNLFLLGAISMGLAVSGTVFLRYWRQTSDRFFLFFTASFWIEAINRVVLAMMPHPNEASTAVYIVRFLAFFLIIVAVADKNMRRS